MQARMTHNRSFAFERLHRFPSSRCNVPNSRLQDFFTSDRGKETSGMRTMASGSVQAECVFLNVLRARQVFQRAESRIGDVAERLGNSVTLTTSLAYCSPPKVVFPIHARPIVKPKHQPTIQRGAARSTSICREMRTGASPLRLCPGPRKRSTS